MALPGLNRRTTRAFSLPSGYGMAVTDGPQKPPDSISGGGAPSGRRFKAESIKSLPDSAARQVDRVQALSYYYPKNPACEPGYL
jgi:hypothetical protein